MDYKKHLAFFYGDRRKLIIAMNTALDKYDMSIKTEKILKRISDIKLIINKAKWEDTQITPQ